MPEPKTSDPIQQYLNVMSGNIPDWQNYDAEERLIFIEAATGIALANVLYSGDLRPMIADVKQAADYTSQDSVRLAAQSCIDQIFLDFIPVCADNVMPIIKQGLKDKNPVVQSYAQANQQKATAEKASFVQQEIEGSAIPDLFTLTQNYLERLTAYGEHIVQQATSPSQNTIDIRGLFRAQGMVIGALCYSPEITPIIQATQDVVFDHTANPVARMTAQLLIGTIRKHHKNQKKAVAATAALVEQGCRDEYLDVIGLALNNIYKIDYPKASNEPLPRKPKSSRRPRQNYTP